MASQKISHRLLTLLIAAIIGSLLFSACTSYKTTETEQENNTQTIDVSTAKEIALKAADLNADDVIFTKANLDYRDGENVYDIEFVTGKTKYAYEISATDETIAQSSKDDIFVNIPDKATEYITADKAKQLVLQDADLSAVNTTFTKMKFDIRDNLPAYDIEFVSGDTAYVYTVNAKDGAILEHNAETR